MKYMPPTVTPAEARRQELELSQVFMAKKTGLSRQAVAKLLAGEGNPLLSTARKIAHVLGQEVDVLFPEDEPYAPLGDRRLVEPDVDALVPRKPPVARGKPGDAVLHLGDEFRVELHRNGRHIATETAGGVVVHAADGVRIEVGAPRRTPAGGRPRGRRTRKSSSTSSAGSGDPDPEPPPLRRARP